MKTIPKVLIIVLSVIALIGFLVWWFRYRRKPYTSARAKKYRVPEQEVTRKKITRSALGPDLSSAPRNVPKTVHVAYPEVDSLNDLKNIKEYCRGYTVEIYGTQRCEDFLYEYYGPDAMQLFRELKAPEKTDFWRYCVLYAHGGYCFDAKTEFRNHLDDIFRVNSKQVWYCSIDEKKTLRNRVIVTAPNNPIIWKLITGYYTSKVPDFNQLVRRHSLGPNMRPGVNTLNNGWDFILLEQTGNTLKKAIHLPSLSEGLKYKDTDVLYSGLRISPDGKVTRMKKNPVVVIVGSLPIYTLETILLADNGKSYFELYYHSTNILPCLQLLQTKHKIKIFELDYARVTAEMKAIELNHMDVLSEVSIVQSHGVIKKLDSCSLFNPSTPGYRLGDMVRVHQSRERPDGKKLHLRLYPDSIASEYIRRANWVKDYNVLGDIVNERSAKHESQPEDIIVLHLRVGDVVNDTEESVSTILAKQVYISDDSWAYYTSALVDIEKALSVFPRQHKVVIVAGAHFDGDHSKSCEYLAAVKHHLEKTGYSVTMRLGKEPDDDFIFMCKAPNFISSGGGFSRNVVAVRKVLNSGPTIALADLPSSQKLENGLSEGTCTTFLER